MARETHAAGPEKPAEKQNKAPTSIDVARLAGVSQTSVSRVFNKEWDARVSDALREKIMAAAQRLGYHPNVIARGLNIRKTGIIGVVLAEQFSAFYYDMLCKLTNAFQAHDLRVMVFNIAPDNDINNIITRLTQYQVDGVVITSNALIKVVSEKWVQSGLPVVVLNAQIPGLSCSSVFCDNYEAGRRMAKHLMGLGRRRFAYVSSGKSLYSDHQKRTEGFVRGLEQLGVRDCTIIPGDFSYESGLAAGRMLFGGGVAPDAVFCGGEEMALGVMDAARMEFGLHVPRDVAVAGYDDSSSARLKSYDLTAIHQPVEEMVDETVRLILAQIAEGDFSPRSICRPVKLVVRSSTAGK